MARLNGHRQTKGTETDKPIPTATAPHLDSTSISSCKVVFLIFPIHTTFQLVINKKWLNSNLTYGTSICGRSDSREPFLCSCVSLILSEGFLSNGANYFGSIYKIEPT